jgi:hypothetical protein
MVNFNFLIKTVNYSAQTICKHLLKEEKKTLKLKLFVSLGLFVVLLALLPLPLVL